MYIADCWFKLTLYFNEYVYNNNKKKKKNDDGIEIFNKYRYCDL